MGMGKAKWWICDGCKSLNDVPANKCYKCRDPKPADPTLIDDEYSEVGGGQKRVGVTVDLSQVGDLTRPDPVEKAQPGGIMEAFDKVDDPYADLDARRAATPTPRYDPYAGDFEQPQATQATEATPPQMREPTKRGIDAIGGRQWVDEPSAPAEGPVPPPPPEAPRDE